MTSPQNDKVLIVAVVAAFIRGLTRKREEQ